MSSEFTAGDWFTIEKGLDALVDQNLKESRSRAYHGDNFRAVRASYRERAREIDALRDRVARHRLDIRDES